MVKVSASFAALAVLLPVVSAQSQVWGQCGGIGWTGATTCVAGSSCVEQNSYYSQCLPGAAAPSSVPAGPSQTSTASSGSPTSGSTAKLQTVAKSAGKLYFGTATDNSELSDTAYTAILDDNTMFGQITPANSMKWDATEPSQGQFTFSGADQIANLAKTNGMLLRGHNCVWYNQLPSWVSNGGFTTAQLTSIIQTHCSTLVGRYKGQVCTCPSHSWDVVNEPFNDDGTWRSDVFYNTLGTSFVEIALNAARQADPTAKIYINDYNIESPGAKSTAMQNLVKSLKSSNVPIDGVGLQCHFIVGETPSSASLIQNMNAFTALGVEVAITELDIRMTLPSTAALLAQQKTDYTTVISACQAVSGCVGVTVWDWTDKYSWVPSTFSGQGAACPWDQNFQKKPAFDGIVTGFGN
ncbi:glycoside hydrolase superfamily [Irpex rosettiformis]|uniref:Glycoside hydrolase superfamily n=1 Tax=Irpex rosettiformis TaxID=378272 RepID=A0ACB8U9L0_9APHY|nr:glycoside hydrolase superfamily [Irpex rosettiformis]